MDSSSREAVGVPLPRIRTRKRMDEFYLNLSHEKKKKLLSQSGNTPPQSSSGAFSGTCSVNVAATGEKKRKEREESYTTSDSVCSTQKKNVVGSSSTSPDKGKKRVETGNRKVSPESMRKQTSLETEQNNDDDDAGSSSDSGCVFAGEFASNTGSGLGSKANVGSAKGRSPKEVVSSTSSMGTGAGHSKQRKSDGSVDSLGCTDTTETSESESSEATSEEDNDDPQDKDFGVNVASSSSLSDDMSTDSDDDSASAKESGDDGTSSPVMQKRNEEGKGELNDESEHKACLVEISSSSEFGTSTDSDDGYDGATESEDDVNMEQKSVEKGKRVDESSFGDGRSSFGADGAGGKESDDDDDESSPAVQRRKEESNEGLLPQRVVDGRKHRSYNLRARLKKISKSSKKRLSLGGCTSPIQIESGESESSSEEEFESGKVSNIVKKSRRKMTQKKNVCHRIDSGESESSSEEDGKPVHRVENVAQKGRRKTTQKKHNLKGLNFVKLVMDSIFNVDDFNDKIASPEEKAPVKPSLPLKFRFEDEDPIPPPKEEWEKENDALFAEMEMCMLQSSIGSTNPSLGESDDVTAAEVNGCLNGMKHQPILDEQIGVICKICSHVFLESKYVFPSFAERTRGRHQRRYFGESSSFLDLDKFRCGNSSIFHSSPIEVEGTVWELVPALTRATMYPHQLEGFEFMWKNIAGDISIEKLKEPLPSLGGCIIGHTPGTGKTRLTLVFLQAYLKLFPKCRPLIIAPPKLLPNWEAEFQKWKVDIPFHNLSNEEFTGQEDPAIMNVFCRLPHGAKEKQKQMNVRMLKLQSWAKGTSILGISYKLFEQLTREEREDAYAKEIRKILLEYPGLLILEEGHIARSKESLLLKALKKVKTDKRILLSGTIFQNNFEELYNTISVVSAKFAAGLEQKWASVTSSVDKDVHAVAELRDMIAPLTHVCSENVKRESLPGIRATMVYLKPTDLQKSLLTKLPEKPTRFEEESLLSKISFHPSLVANKKKFSDLIEGLHLNPDHGVKMKFVVELIRLCDGLRERVIIFSQLLSPLQLIEKQLKSLFHWTSGREILYVDGKLDMKQRQTAISSLNDPKSDVKVLLASTKACAEGITLIGASRVVMLDVLWNPSVEGQAISRAYRNGQKKVVHVYHLLALKWELSKIEKQARKKYQSDILLYRDEVKMNPSCSVSDDMILDTMVQHESLRHIFDGLPSSHYGTL